MRYTYTLKETMEAAANISTFITPDKTIEIAGVSINLTYDDDILASRGLVLGAAMNTTIGPFIIISNKLKGDEQLTNFVIAHEAGHILNGDLDKIPSSQVIGNIKRCCLAIGGNVQPEELAADAFAVSMIGKKVAISSLKKIMTSEKMPTSSRKEIANRIKVIQKMK